MTLKIFQGALQDDISSLEVERLTAACLCILFFAVLNPFLALCLIAALSLFLRIPLLIFITFASLSFSLFFFRREYGVEFYPGISGDDIPAYISLYLANEGLTFFNLLSRFIVAPNGNEILWHLPWSIALNQFGISVENFVFLHYLLNFVMLFIALFFLSSRHWVILAAVYFFLTPLTVDGLTHIWRQQLAGSMFILGVGLKYRRKSRLGDWLIFITPLIHLSMLFFLSVYCLYLLMRHFGTFMHKSRFILSMIILMGIVFIFLPSAVVFLDSLGIERISSYYNGKVDTMRLLLIFFVYAMPMLSVYLLFKTDDINRLFFVLSFSVFSIAFLLPGSSGIYDRLFLFTFPLMGIYFYRSLICQLTARTQIIFLIAIFLLAYYRMYLPTMDGYGVMSFLANGDAFNPFIGLINLLIS